ncbi:hypothetical protein [Sphingobium sp. BYY-5]|nr:hypothetical protein [Sphingobium sp. BYY-5]
MGGLSVMRVFSSGMGFDGSGDPTRHLPLSLCVALAAARHFL